MSIQAIAWVIEVSESKLADRLVLYSIANHADQNGLAAWPSVKTIARESRISERQVQRSLSRLKKIGELDIFYGMSNYGTNYFVISKMIRPLCWYCGSELFMAGREIDHQIPVSRKGKDLLENLVYACRQCNGTKGDRNVDEYRIQTGGKIFFGETERGRQSVTRPGDKDMRHRVTNRRKTKDRMSPEPSLSTNRHKDNPRAKSSADYPSPDMNLSEEEWQKHLDRIDPKRKKV